MTFHSADPGSCSNIATNKTSHIYRSLKSLAAEGKIARNTLMKLVSCHLAGDQYRTASLIGFALAEHHLADKVFGHLIGDRGKYQLPDVPDGFFVNDIKADLHDADTVYVVVDDHKSGDFSPYILKSTNRGKSWRSIVWRT